MYTHVASLAQDVDGELLFPKRKLKVRARQGFAVVWDSVEDHQGEVPRDRPRYGASLRFKLR